MSLSQGHRHKLIPIAPVGFENTIPVFQLTNVFNVLRPSGHDDRHKLATGNKYSNDNASLVGSVGIAAGWTTGIRFTAGANDFCFPHSDEVGGPCSTNGGEKERL
jgi:hypothetical protein